MKQDFSWEGLRPETKRELGIDNLLPKYSKHPSSDWNALTASTLPDEIAFACGHTSPRPDSVLSSATVAWMAENGQCHDCWKQRQCNAANEFAEENDLPALRGTDKQIDWASSLRREALSDLQARLRLAEVHGRATAVKKLAKTLKGVREITSAAAWIDAREFSPEALLTIVQERLRPRRRSPR